MATTHAETVNAPMAIRRRRAAACGGRWAGL